MFIIEILLYIYMHFVVSLPCVNALHFFPNVMLFSKLWKPTQRKKSTRQGNLQIYKTFIY